MKKNEVEVRSICRSTAHWQFVIVCSNWNESRGFGIVINVTLCVFLLEEGKENLWIDFDFNVKTLYFFDDYLSHLAFFFVFSLFASGVMLFFGKGAHYFHWRDGTNQRQYNGNRLSFNWYIFLFFSSSSPLKKHFIHSISTYFDGLTYIENKCRLWGAIIFIFTIKFPVAVNSVL